VTRVLVVDDEPQLLRALRINLRARDYDVDTAPHATAALAAAARHPPDVVILDLGVRGRGDAGRDRIHGAGAGETTLTTPPVPSVPKPFVRERFDHGDQLRRAGCGRGGLRDRLQTCEEFRALATQFDAEVALFVAASLPAQQYPREVSGNQRERHSKDRKRPVVSMGKADCGQ
jgi:CheY-like chemotaxis protein